MQWLPRRGQQWGQNCLMVWEKLEWFFLQPPGGAKKAGSWGTPKAWPGDGAEVTLPTVGGRVVWMVSPCGFHLSTESSGFLISPSASSSQSPSPGSSLLLSWGSTSGEKSRKTWSLTVEVQEPWGTLGPGREPCVDPTPAAGSHPLDVPQQCPGRQCGQGSVWWVQHRRFPDPSCPATSGSGQALPVRYHSPSCVLLPSPVF